MTSAKPILLFSGYNRNPPSTHHPDTTAMTIRPATHADLPAIRELIFAVLAEFGLQPDPGATDADLNDLEAAYQHDGGCFDVVENDRGDVIGTVGLYPIDATHAELRKMYLAPTARGQGLGQTLLDRIIARARTAGFHKIQLETATVLTDAIRLYERNGFRPVTTEDLSPRCDQAYFLDLA